LGSKDVRPTAAAALHVTLRFFGDAELEAVTHRMDQIALPSSVATMGPKTVMPFGPGILLVPVSGLDVLVQEAAASTADLGVPPQPYWGHMEVARSVRSVEDVAGVPVDISFAVTEVALVESTWVNDGPIFSIVRTWPAGC